VSFRRERRHKGQDIVQKESSEDFNCKVGLDKFGDPETKKQN
jgi:hypothetical protein